MLTAPDGPDGRRADLSVPALIAAMSEPVLPLPLPPVGSGLLERL